MIRYLNTTDSNEQNNYNIQSSFSFFDDRDYQNKRVQQPFRVEKLNAWHIGTFVYDEHNPDWIVNFTQNKSSRCRSDREHLITRTRKSWKLRITNAELTYDDKNNQMIHDGYILPCYHSDGFCKPTTRTSYTLTWVASCNFASNFDYKNSLEE